MRLFVAVYPPGDALDHLAEAVSALAIDQARLAARANWHVTLAFLGEVPDGAVEDAGAAVDRTAAGMAPLRLRIAGAGRFPGKVSHLWAGLAGDLAGLQDAGRGLRRELRDGHLPYDERPLRPHLTLARAPGAAFDRELAALDRYQGPQWTVDAVHLVRSQPGRPPRYDRIHTAPVREGTGAAVT